MVSRMARPKRWQAQDFVSTPFLNSPRHSSDDIGICRQGEMWAMLFEGAEREKDERVVPLKLFDFQPTQIFQKHRLTNGVGNSVKGKTQNAND
jgi:hypothetical protein